MCQQSQILLDVVCNRVRMIRSDLIWKAILLVCNVSIGDVAGARQKVCPSNVVDFFLLLQLDFCCPFVSKRHAIIPVKSLSAAHLLLWSLLILASPYLHLISLGPYPSSSCSFPRAPVHAIPWQTCHTALLSGRTTSSLIPVCFPSSVTLLGNTFKGHLLKAYINHHVKKIYGSHWSYLGIAM